MNPKLALVLGFLIGIAAGACGMYFARTGNSTRSEAAPTNVPLKEVAEAAREKNSRGPNWWGMDAPTPEIGPTRTVSETSQPAAVISDRTNSPPERSGRGEDWRNMSEAERQQRFATFWSNQQVTTRAAFISNTVLSADEAVKFDVLTAAMNVRLSARLDPIVKAYESGWRPSPEERTRIAQDVSTILVNTYDEMDRNMPADWREGATNSYFSLTQFVDPRYMPFMRGMSSPPPGMWGGGGSGGGFFGGPPPASTSPAPR
jgi:hypothetical protein